MTRLVYKLGDKIGKGSSGTVYRATLSDGRTVAVKRLSPGHSALRHHREAHTLARLDHPNIVQFYALQRAPRNPDQYDLITELVPGITLGKLYRGGRLPVLLAVYVVRQILAALEHMHSTTDLVHRDVSPGNVLIGHDGQVKLADFGLTKPSGAARTTTVLRGTPPYLSPEHVSYDDVGVQSDLFVVGIHLYRLLTGTMPLHGDGIADLEEQSPLVPPIALRPDLPRVLDAVTRKLLEYDPENRYASATEVLTALPDVDVAGIDLAALLRQQQMDTAWWKPAIKYAAGLAAAALIGAGITYALVPEGSATPADELAQELTASDEEEQSAAAVCEPTVLPNSTELDDADLATHPPDTQNAETSNSTSQTHTPRELTPKRAGPARATPRSSAARTDATARLDMTAQPTPHRSDVSPDRQDSHPLTAADQHSAYHRGNSPDEKVSVPPGTRVYTPSD